MFMNFSNPATNDANCLPERMRLATCYVRKIETVVVTMDAKVNINEINFVPNDNHTSCGEITTGYCDYVWANLL